MQECKTFLLVFSFVIFIVLINFKSLTSSIIISLSLTILYDIIFFVRRFFKWNRMFLKRNHINLSVLFKNLHRIHFCRFSNKVVYSRMRIYRVYISMLAAWVPAVPGVDNRSRQTLNLLELICSYYRFY